MASVPSSARSAGEVAASKQLPADLVPLITRHLEDVGEYRLVLDPREAQRLVDIRWAALGAGRALGRKVEVVTSRAVETRDAPIAVVVRFEDSARPPIPPQRGH
jgi:hypothetical protein